MRVTNIVAVALLASAIGMAKPAAAQPPPAGAPTTIAVAVQRAYATIKTNFTQAADKMPDADYNFKPGPAVMADTRPFGALIAHIAQSQFGTCAAAKGVPNPMMGRQLESELKTKAEIVKALADSFALCDDAYAALSDSNISELVMQGRGQIARAAMLSNNVVHNNEMAGTAYAYLRAKGIVPPSTENAQAARGGGAGGRGAGTPPPGR